MDDVSTDKVHLRELAAKCRRVAATLTDQGYVASLRKMAAQYESIARSTEPPLMPNPQPSISY